MLNGKLTRITCEIPIPEGYEFVRIDNVLQTGDYRLSEFNEPTYSECYHESPYLWVIVKKIEN